MSDNFWDQDWRPDDFFRNDQDEQRRESSQDWQQEQFGQPETQDWNESDSAGDSIPDEYEDPGEANTVIQPKMYWRRRQFLSTWLWLIIIAFFLVIYFLTVLFGVNA